MNNRFGRVPPALAVLAVCLACVVLHEGGHVLAGYAAGARVANVEILSARPHVRIAGLGAAGTACTALAGSFLVLTACAFTMRRRTPALLRDTAMYCAGAEVLGWALSALFLPRLGRGNDVAKFVAATGAAPEAVFLAAVGMGWWLLHRARNVCYTPLS